jgi:glutamate-1-semialdehyde 2,1-aminomutase
MSGTSWIDRASRVLPTGASTGSKRAAALYGEGEAGPSHFRNAAGCRITTADGEEIVDLTMALGSVALGYAENAVTRAVTAAARQGNVAGLSHMLEVEIAEQLCEVIPCAEKVQFLKTGAEAIAAAVRLARAYTGRSAVVGSGYFGWLDWCSSAAGVPEAVRGDFHNVPFDDVPALEAAVSAAGSDLAAIVLEPVVERLPSDQWLARARALTDARGAVLIFDEIKTGFRVATGGYQEVSGVTPDLAAFGKALANGYPLSVVCGHTDLMDGARKTWISSTLASEATALAAAGAVLERHRTVGVSASLARIGSRMRRAIERVVKDSGADVEVCGIDPMWFLRFASPQKESRFVHNAVTSGRVLFKRGAYNFASLAHDEAALVVMEAAAREAFNLITQAEGKA